jgi:CRP-like cAMP-binding protein
MASVDRAELAKVPALQGLPEEELTWFLEQCEERTLAAGEIHFREDDPADSMIVVLEGEIQARWEQGGDVTYWTIGPGAVSGKLPFSRMTHYSVSARAILPSRILRFQAARFNELIQRCPELVRRLVGVMSDRIRATGWREWRSSRLANSRQDSHTS